MNTITTANTSVYGSYAPVNPSTYGYTYTTNNSTSPINVSIPSNNYVYSTSISAAEYNIDNRTIKINGDADVDGDILIKGKSLTDILNKIEERLSILKPNVELEERWDELKELSKRYRELEKELLEKEEVWKILKK
jgi:hypothetical protein